MSNERIHYLNGLRGILAVIVFLHHYFYLFAPDFIFGGSYDQFLAGQWGFTKIVAYSPLNLLYNPGTAINFFFLLSGYVQSFHYFKTNDLTFVQKSFIKRYFRLVVPTLTAVLLVFLFHRLNLINKNIIPKNDINVAWIKRMLPDNLNFLEALKYGFVCMVDGSSKYYQILWTMSIELYSSFMILVILMVTHNIKNKVTLIVFWLLILIFVLQAFYSVSFTIGLLVCQLHNETKFTKVFVSKVLKWFCLVIGLYFSSYPYSGYELASQKSMYAPISFFDQIPHVISYIIGNTLLFLVIINSQRIKNFLGKKAFLFLGTVSFMFYMIHFLILLSLSAFFYHYLSNKLYAPANVAITGILSLIAVTIVAYLLTKIIDAPLVKYCNLFVKKLFGN